MLEYCGKVHTRAVNGLESHLNYVHFILPCFSLQNGLCLQKELLFCEADSSLTWAVDTKSTEGQSCCAAEAGSCHQAKSSP